MLFGHEETVPGPESKRPILTGCAEARIGRVLCRVVGRSRASGQASAGAMLSPCGTHESRGILAHGNRLRRQACFARGCAPLSGFLLAAMAGKRRNGQVAPECLFCQAKIPRERFATMPKYGREFVTMRSCARSPLAPAACPRFASDAVGRPFRDRSRPLFTTAAHPSCLCSPPSNLLPATRFWA